MRVVKYLMLIVPAILVLYVDAPYGDRCSGLAHALAWLVLVGVYAFIFLVLTTIDLYFLFSIKKSFDLGPLIITCVAGILGITFWESRDAKPWTEKVYVGRVEETYTRDATLLLYADGSFDAQTAYADWSCTYVGPYEWRHDTLSLLRSDLTSLTDSAFTINYLLSLPDSSLLPLEVGFKPMLRLTPAS